MQKEKEVYLSYAEHITCKSCYSWFVFFLLSSHLLSMMYRWRILNKCQCVTAAVSFFWRKCIIGSFNITGVCLLVCDLDNTKTTEQISSKIVWRTGLGPEWTPLTFGADPWIVLCFFEFVRSAFLDISANNSLILMEKHQAYLGGWHPWVSTMWCEY